MSREYSTKPKAIAILDEKMVTMVHQYDFAQLLHCPGRN
jgi:hypothetical protein